MAGGGRSTAAEAGGATPAPLRRRGPLRSCMRARYFDHVIQQTSRGIPGKQHWAAAAVTPASDQKLVKCLLAAQSLQTDWLR